MTRHSPVRFCLFCILTAVCFILACSGSASVNTPPPPPPAAPGVVSIVVTPTSANMSLGSTQVLSAEARDVAGQPVAATFAWHTSLGSVATVDANGKVTAVSAGVTNITASNGTITSANIPVTAYATFVTPVGTPNGVAVTQSIGPAGGSLQTADGQLKVIVPANALASTVTLTIQPITNTTPGGLGAGFQLLPDGQTFAVPVQLVFTFSDEELAGTTADVLAAAYQTVGGSWRELKSGSYSATAKTLTVSTSHLSNWGKLAGVQLKPASASVHTSGHLSLTVVDCRTGDAVPGSEFLAELFACVPGVVGQNGWAVNGAPGGSGSVGTVAGGTGGATYNAPSNTPSPNPVAVSATISTRTRTGALQSVLVVSNVLVFSDDSWTGTAAYLGNPSLDAQVHWVLESRVNNVATYRATGTVTATLPPCTLSPSSHAIDPTIGYLIVDFNPITPTYRAFGGTSWDATLLCPPSAPLAFSVPGIFLPEVTGNVTVVAGTATITGQSQFQWQWTFRRDPQQ